MSDAPDPSRFRFAFNATYDEEALFMKLLQEHVRRFMDFHPGRAISLLSFAVVAIPSSVAALLDWQPPSSVFWAMGSWLVGTWGYVLGTTWGTDKLQRKLFARTRGGEITWQLSFSDATIDTRRGIVESRVPWDAIRAVQDAQSIVILWVGARHGVYVPPRCFTDSASRTSFTEWALGRVRNAGQASDSATHDSAAISVK